MSTRFSPMSEWSTPVGSQEPRVALDMHMAKWESLGSDLHLALMDTLTTSLYTGTDRDSHLDEILAIEDQALDTGVTLFMTKDMISVTSEAGAMLAGTDEIFHEDDLPAPCGFAWLGGTFEYEQRLEPDDFSSEISDDGASMTMPVVAFAWCKTQTDPSDTAFAERLGFGGPVPGLALFIYADRAYIRAARRALDNDETFAQAEDRIHEVGGLVCVDIHLMILGVGGAGGAMRSAMNYGSGMPLNDVARQILATFRLMNQKIPFESTRHPDRARRRRLDRIGAKLPDDGTVRVIQMRRMESDPNYEPPDGEPDDSQRFWSHRWSVSPHWRDQHYPSLGPARLPDGTRNPASHRRVWIDRYVKGPEWAPFIVKPSVLSLER